MPAPATRSEQPTTRMGPARPTPVAAPVRLEWWERLGGFLLQFRALRILMRVRMVLTWVSLLIVAVTLTVSPVARTVLGAWIGCFWIVAVCF